MAETKKTKQIHTCYKHPLKEAKRRCYNCRKYICPKCQIKLDNHIFCSKKCHKDNKKKETKEKVGEFIKKKGKYYAFRIIFYPLLAVLILLSYFLYKQWISTIDQSEVKAPEISAKNGKKATVPDWSAPSSIEITLPAENASISESEINVAGVAPRESMVGLYVNSEKIDAVFSDDGKFLFEKIPIKSKESILQVRYFDNYGNNAYSKAIKIQLVANPSKLEIPKREEPFFSPVLSSFLDLRQAREGNKTVLLTFDGGSNDNSTDSIIKTLEETGVKATIFLTGEYIKKYPDKVRIFAKNGHIIGNHTYSHPHLTTYSFNEKHATLPGINKEKVLDQLMKTETLYESVTGKKMSPFWRAPFGEKNSEILKWANEAGYRHVFWTPKLDTLDWVADKSNPLFREPKEILKSILKESQKSEMSLDGGIVLMHLGSEREGELRADTILRDLIRELKAKGYSFITVEDTKWAKFKESDKGG
ncbi:MAG: polysaccharide deacetylase family protein [Acidobacteria bacterium]|nr:polysaccharide deacetylase family protein [Acidobacteriota bacterium]